MNFRKFVVLCFVLAGVVTLAQEAHCLGISQSAGEFSVAAPGAAGNMHGHGKHLCHHDHGKNSHASWAFVLRPAPNLLVPVLVPASPSQIFAMPSSVQTLALPSTRASPPTRRSRSGTRGFDEIFAVTGRLLI